MAWLGQEILDPVIDELGAICITYGYAGRNLTRSIKSRISPDLDQHAGCELAGNSAPICRRDGQAVDFEVPDVPSSRVASFIVDRLPFDRLYYYGRDRPLHVSIGPERCGAIIVVLAGASGRRVPRQMTRDRFLRFLRDGDLKI